MLLGLQVTPAICTTNDQILTIDVGLSIKVNVKEENIPIPCRVRLFEKQSGRLVLDQPTNNDGFVEFNHLAPVYFFAVVHHPVTNFNAMIFDKLLPKK